MIEGEESFNVGMGDIEIGVLVVGWGIRRGVLGGGFRVRGRLGGRRFRRWLGRGVLGGWLGGRSPGSRRRGGAFHVVGQGCDAGVVIAAEQIAQTADVAAALLQVCGNEIEDLGGD